MNRRSLDTKETFLYEAALTIGAKLETNEVLQRLMKLTHAYFQPDAVSVAWVNADGSLVFRAASGKSAEQIIGMEIQPGTGIVGWVAHHGEGLWVPDVYKDKRFYRGTDKKTGFRTTSILAVPVKLEEQTFAVVEMINPRPDTNIYEAQDTMTTLASMVAPAIQNARRIEESQQAEARYRSLFTQSPDPIAILNPDGRIMEVNQAAQAHLGLLPEDNGLERLHLTAEEFAGLKEKVTAEGHATWQAQIQSPDATMRILDMHLSAIPYTVLTHAYMWLAHDITDQVNLNDTYQELFDILAHDLRVPLGNIINTLDMTITAWHENDREIPVIQVLGIGLRSAQRMSRLISNMLDIGRLTGGAALSITAINIPTMVAETLEAVMPTMKQREHAFTQHIPDTLPPMFGDAERIQRTLLNILDNAVRYTPEGGTIKLYVHADDHNFRFAVSDTGPGIAPENQAPLFDIASGVYGRKPRGTGIGLAFCKLAVEAHGGHIDVQSDKGKGSVFYFTIPRLLPESSVSPTEMSDD